MGARPYGAARQVIAALFCDPLGVYNRLGVDLWCEARDARLYAGPWPVVAHPPCQRWGRFWHGSPRKPHRFRLGDDGGCFASALYAVRTWGGVIEHPADSHAWDFFRIPRPLLGDGWRIIAGIWPAATCYVQQGHYGHFSSKGTWLYAVRTALPELDWTMMPQTLDPVMVERHGYEYARRKGLVSMVGGKDKTKIRNATPPEFAKILISMAQSVK